MGAGVTLKETTPNRIEVFHAKIKVRISVRRRRHKESKPYQQQKKNVRIMDL